MEEKMKAASFAEPEKKQRNTVNAIDKTLSVIDFLARGEATFTEILQALRLPKATLHRILQSLEDHDYISRNSITDKYSLGIKFVYYGGIVKSSISIVSIAEPYIQALAQNTGEYASLGVFYHDVSFSLYSVDGDPSALTAKLMPLSPLNCSSSGKLFLAHMDDDTLQGYFRSDKWERNTINSICTFEQFKTEQKKILKQDIAFDDEEFEYGVFCMSAPLYNHEGFINANIGITGPKARIMMKGLDKIESAVRKCSADISTVLKSIRYEFEY